MTRETTEQKARPGLVLVWAAVVLFAAGNPVVRLLADAGRGHPVDGRNPITPCNVLLVSTFCAFVVLAAIHHRSWRPAALARLPARDWLGMSLGAVLSSALAPAFTLLALEHTSVTNLVLIGRLEPFLFLLLATLVLRESLDRFALAGSVVVLAGVGLASAIENGGAPAFGEGELYAALAAASFAASTIVSRQGVQRVPLGIFVVFRTGLATVVFFWTAVYLYGFQHFRGVTSPFLWQAMAVYGAIVLAGAQLCWFAGLRRARAGDVALAGAFSPVAGVLSALVFLGESPGPGLAAGGVVILAGTALGLFGAEASRHLRSVLRAGARARLALDPGRGWPLRPRPGRRRAALTVALTSS